MNVDLKDYLILGASLGNVFPWITKLLGMPITKEAISCLDNSHIKMTFFSSVEWIQIPAKFVQVFQKLPIVEKRFWYLLVQKSVGNVDKTSSCN